MEFEFAALEDAWALYLYFSLEDGVWAGLVTRPAAVSFCEFGIQVCIAYWKDWLVSYAEVCDGDASLQILLQPGLHVGLEHAVEEIPGLGVDEQEGGAWLVWP